MTTGSTDRTPPTPAEIRRRERIHYALEEARHDLESIRRANDGKGRLLVLDAVWRLRATVERIALHADSLKEGEE